MLVFESENVEGEGIAADIEQTDGDESYVLAINEDEVEQTKRRGKKLIVVDPEAADRYHDRCDRANERAPAQSVMS